MLPDLVIRILVKYVADGETGSREVVPRARISILAVMVATGGGGNEKESWNSGKPQFLESDHSETEGSFRMQDCCIY